MLEYTSNIIAPDRLSNEPVPVGANVTAYAQYMNCSINLLQQGNQTLKYGVFTEILYGEYFSAS